jgi:ABC-2 type transport system permease protein
MKLTRKMINKKTNSISKYVEYFKIGFKKSLEYKSYLIGTITTPIFMGIFFYFIWSYIYQVKGGGDPSYLIGGFTFNEMIVYLVIGLLIQTVKGSNIAESISQTIKSGDIVIFLCRPVDFVKSLISDGIGSKVIPFGTFAILLGVMTYISKISFPTIDIFLLFVIYGVMLIFFQLLLEILIGGLAFWLTEIWGVRSSINQIFWILSGRALPLSLFPKIMQTALQWTPFFYLEYTFARIYLGKLAFNEIIIAMGIFIVWIIALILFMKWIYSRGFRKMETLGG